MLLEIFNISRHDIATNRKYLLGFMALSLLSVYLISKGVATSSVFSVGLICLSFAFGAIGCNYILKHQYFAIENIPVFMKWKRKPLPGIKHSKRCAVCGNRKCKRHRPEPSIHILKPWTDLLIPRDADDKFEEILNLTVEKYILSWYNVISADDAFVQELKISLRFISSSLFKRVKQIDAITVITGKIAARVLLHVDQCIRFGRLFKLQPLYTSFPSTSSNLKGDLNLEERTVLRNLKRHLHVALRSRKSELLYLQSLAEKLLPLLIPKYNLSSRTACSLVREVFAGSLLQLMDLLADPDTLNELLILFFDKTPMIQYPKIDEPHVELLRNYEVQNSASGQSVLRTDLQTILSHQQLLFPFMQFLKEEAAVNILQFCLSVDDFNKRILNPDLSPDHIISLHKDVQEMFSTYFAYGAVDRLNFDDIIVEEMKTVVENNPKEVLKLRTTPTLFQAYDYAYTLLEKVYCPLFHQSDRYFKLLCGDRLINSGNRNLWKSSKKGPEPSTMSKLGSKIKGVLATNIDNGKVCDEEAGVDLSEGLTTDSLFEEEEDLYKVEEDPTCLRNLSAWRISIPRVETFMDLNCKYYHAYIIDIQRIDVKDDEKPEDTTWSVQRRYNEFYILHAKLMEFHGVNLDVHLPPKRSFGNKGKLFLESKRLLFEKFIQDLLTVPSLRGSELLHKFLRSPVEFTTSFLPEINLGKMFKTVPMKLLKEKGQHLLPFLQTLVCSTECAKPKPSTTDWKEIYELPPPPAMTKLNNSLFEDNCANVIFKRDSGSPMAVFSGNLDSIYDYILYLLMRVFWAPTWLVQLLVACGVVLRQLLQAYTEWYLDMKIREALHTNRVVALLNHLKYVLFTDESSIRNSEEKVKLKYAALAAAQEYFPGWMTKAVGTEKFKDGIKTLFIILQNPRLNKQLSYMLLDDIVLELFPELRDDTPSPP